MKKIIPVILILLGIAEIVIAALDIKVPAIAIIAIGCIYIAIGVNILIYFIKKK